MSNLERNAIPHDRHSTSKRVAPNWLFIVSVVGLVALSVFYWSVGDVTDISRKIRGVVIVFLSGTPLLLYARQPERNFFPLFVFNMLYYAMGFATGGFFLAPARFEARMSKENIEFSQFMVIVGIVCQIVGYLIFQSKKNGARSGGKMLAANQLRVCGWLMILAPFIPGLIVDLSASPSISVLLRLSSMAGAAVLFSLSITRCLKLAEKLIFSVLMLYLLWQGMLSGSIAESLRFGLVFILVATLHERYAMAGLIGAIALAVLFLANPVKGDYRAMTWNEDGISRYTDKQKTVIYCELIYDHNMRYLQGGFRSKGQEGEGGYLERVNQFFLMGIVVSETPRRVPYWYGETFFDLAYAMIPRVLWANKPIKRTGNAFGKRYSIISQSDDRTSVNLPWIVELYANFGIFGLVTGMFVFGSLFALIEAKLLVISAQQPGNIVLVGLFGPLAYPESSISLLWGSVVLGFVALKIGVAVVQSFVPARRSLAEKRRLQRFTS